MSRVGRSPIAVPSSVTVTLSGPTVNVKGPQGSLERTIPEPITIAQEGDMLVVSRPDDERRNRALHGLSRSLVANMVSGVTDGYTKELEIVGVGYRATPLRTAHLRDPVGPQIQFASESFIDEIAAAVGTDPVAFRLRYLAILPASSVHRGLFHT